MVSLVLLVGLTVAESVEALCGKQIMPSLEQSPFSEIRLWRNAHLGGGVVT